MSADGECLTLVHCHQRKEMHIEIFIEIFCKYFNENGRELYLLL